MALTAIEGGQSALARVVAAAVRMEQHDEVDRWEFADDVLEAVDDLAPGQNGFDQNERIRQGTGSTGFFDAIDTISTQIGKAGVLTVGRASVVGAYATAKAWPRADRVEGANYWAHFELRAREYDGKRKAHLEKLVHKHAGKVGTAQVRLWKADRKPTVLKPFLLQVENGVRGFLLRKGKPWDRVATDDREAIGQILRKIAYEIETGTFGRKP